MEAPPQPSQDELEALIEEARRRARRRRLLIGGAIAAAVLLAGLATGLVLVFRGGASTAVPKGFDLVQARGPVRHLRFENLLDRGTAIDSSGAANRVPMTQELWWNESSGLTRTVYRRGGRIVADWVEQQCQGSGATRLCTPPWPYIPYQQLPSVAQRPKSDFRRVGTGTFRERRVFWVEQLYQPPGSKPSLGGDQVAYDAVTHQPVALRTIERGGRFKGRTVSYNSLEILPDVPGRTSRSWCPTAAPIATRRALRPSSRATDFPRLGQRSATRRSGSAARSRAAGSARSWPGAMGK